MKEYLGDGIYAELDRGMIKLTTENGICVTNTIHLEPEVMKQLQKFYEKAVESAKKEMGQ